MGDPDRAAGVLRALLTAFNDRDWDRFDTLMDRHLDEDFALQFPRGDAPTVPRSRFRHRTVQATRLYPGLHEEVLGDSGGEDLFWARVRRSWNATDGKVVVDVHVVFEHRDGPAGALLGPAWEFLGPERREPGQR